MMKDYVTLAEDIAKITQEDYAGCQEIKRPQETTAFLAKAATIHDYPTFYQACALFLGSFGDRHLAIQDSTGTILSNNFDVRRYEDALYVTKVTPHAPVEHGAKIIAVDGLTIPQVVAQHANFFDKEPERQLFLPFLRSAQTVTLATGEVVSLVKEPWPFPDETEFVVKSLTPSCAYLKMTDFASQEPLASLIKENAPLLSTTPHLIIDVRKNNGGSDINYYCLLDYLFHDRAEYKKSNPHPKDYLTFNATTRSARLRQASFSPEFIKSLPQEHATYLEEELAFWQENAGKGFVRRFPATVDEEDDDDDYLPTFHHLANPQKIVLLTDIYCGSSGDQFVELGQRSPKVTVMGRNSLGVTDYANCVRQDYGDFKVMYPTSRHSRVDEGRGILGQGLPVDVHIPFTPEHLQRDVDLADALKFLNEK